MPMFLRPPAAATLAATLLAALAGCTTSSGPGDAVAAAAAPQGTIPDYCPQISLRENTAVLRVGEGDALQYVASIVDTTRSCRVIGGEMVMEIGLAGRLVPAVAARPGSTTIPIRIAVSRGTETLYENVGRVQVSTDPGAGPQDFVYVDRSVRTPVPTGRNFVVLVGLEQPAAARR